MANEIVKSQRQEMIEAARGRLVEIETTPKATASDAAKAATLLVKSYPQQRAHDPDVYMRQVREMLIGVPLGVVMQLADPKRGIVTESTFLPTIAEIAKWLHRAMGPMREDYRRQVTMLETLDYEATEIPTPERERRRDTLADLSRDMRERADGPVQISEALEAKMVERFRATQCHDPEKSARMLTEGLANLEAMKPMAEESAE